MRSPRYGGAREVTREPKWMSLALAAKFEPMAKAMGVSEVARSRRGFFPQFKAVGGRFAQLDPWWRNRRNNFVRRHMAQVKAHGEKLVDSKGRPTRRHLALIMWAYSPFSAERLKRMLRDYEENPSFPFGCEHNSGLPTEEDEMYQENPALTQEQIDALGQAYLKGVDISGTPKVREMARTQASRAIREFEKLRKKIRVEFTERDPYASFEELQADVVGNGHMWVFTGFSDTPFWSPEVNWMSRAVHDYDHVVANTDFSLPGEIRAYQFTAARAPELEPLYLSEIALQAASSVVLGGVFPEGAQKVVAADPSVSRIAQEFVRNDSSEEDEEHVASLMAVWDAAGALKVMSPEQLMQRMGAEGVPLDQAMLLVVSAVLASEHSQ